MKLKYILLLIPILLFFPCVVFCSGGGREKVIQETLDELKQEPSPEVKEKPSPEITPIPIISSAQDTLLKKKSLFPATSLQQDTPKEGEPSLSTTPPRQDSLLEEESSLPTTPPSQDTPKQEEHLPPIAPPIQETPLEEESPPELSLRRQGIIKKTLDDVEIEIAFNIGHIRGETTYDFDNHTSELMFPFDNWMAGADFTIGIKDLSLNAEFWGSIEKEVGDKMTDKDWTSGILISSTESTAEMDAIIWDVSLRYDFYKKSLSKNIYSLGLFRSDKLKIGALLGYKYERFDFDIYDLYYPDSGIMSYEGELVGTYKIEYFLPYIGLAVDAVRKNYGLNMNIKYSFLPTAEDVDNHLLRNLTFYGDYDKPDNAFMFKVCGFWEFIKNWRLRLGVDGVFVKIMGGTWEEGGDPAWDKDQFTDTAQVIYWSGLQYKF